MQESTQQELLKLFEKVDKLTEQLVAVRAGMTAPNTRKIPRAVSVSNIIAIYAWVNKWCLTQCTYLFTFVLAVFVD